jgi:hypothetical protein
MEEKTDSMVAEGIQPVDAIAESKAPVGDRAFPWPQIVDDPRRIFDLRVSGDAGDIVEMPV